MDLALRPIGYIESCFQDKFGTPRQPGLVPSARAILHFLPEVQPEISLRGLENFSHIWVLFYFHLNSNERFHAKVHPPRLEGESLGLFASRSPHRPNPIGLSLVEIVELQSSKIIVSGGDFVQGTPLIDVKPYLPQVEAKTEARVDISQLQKANDEALFVWEEESLAQLKNWQLKSPHPDLKSLIEQTISLDPRPLVYRGYEGQSSNYRQRHAVRIFDGDIHFEFLETNKVKILEVRY